MLRADAVDRSVGGVKITDEHARAAIDKLVQDPTLFSSRRAAVAGEATSLMAALGYDPLEGLPGQYEFRASRTPVVLRRLALASSALDAALREEPTRRAAQRFDQLPPEPALGASGTTTLTILLSVRRRCAAATTRTTCSRR